MNANFEDWDFLDNGKPYTYFIHYVGTNCNKPVTIGTRRLRQEIWDFKKGKNQPWIRQAMALTIEDTFDHPEELTLVCLPASNAFNHRLRFERFSNDLCQALGMTNGFDHLQILKDHTPTHEGGDLHDGYWHYDGEFFKGKQVLFFDDVITQGHHMKHFGDALEKLGATVVGGIFIGHTVMYSHAGPDLVHPLTEEPVFL